MYANKSAENLRHAAERETRPDKTSQKARRQADTEAAEAHIELTKPGLSKGRPSPGGDGNDEQRPSNAGTDPARHATSPVRRPRRRRRAAEPASGGAPGDAAATTIRPDHAWACVRRPAAHRPPAPAAGSPSGRCGSSARVAPASAGCSPPSLLLAGHRAA